MHTHLQNVPCKHGHVGKRSLKTGKCSECASLNFKRRYSSNPEKFKTVSNNWYCSNKEKALASSKKWRENNPEKSKQSMETWQVLNKETMNQTARVYRAANLKRHCARQSHRRAAQIQRTPKWVDLEAIKKFYEACPPGMHVDHIVPLRGKEVCGLHVPWNLQYLTASENSRKSNKFESEEF